MKNLQVLLIALMSLFLTCNPGTLAKTFDRTEPNLQATANYVSSQISDDTYFDRQWGLQKIEAPQAWKDSKSNQTVKIAILDSGIDSTHEDLASKIVAERNFTDSDTAQDRYGHGTAVAGIAAAIANNKLGITGVGYDASLMNVKVLGDNGGGAYS